MLLVVEGYQPSVIKIIEICLTSIIGIYAISGGMEGYLHHHTPLWQRIPLIVGGLCMVAPSLITDIVGFVIVAVIVVLQYVIEPKPKKKDSLHA